MLPIAIQILLEQWVEIIPIYIRGRIQKDMQYRDELHVHIVVKINVQLSVHGAVAHENPGDVRGGGAKRNFITKKLNIGDGD